MLAGVSNIYGKVLGWVGGWALTKYLACLLRDVLSMRT